MPYQITGSPQSFLEEARDHYINGVYGAAQAAAALAQAQAVTLARETLDTMATIAAEHPRGRLPADAPAPRDCPRNGVSGLTR